MFELKNKEVILVSGAGEDDKCFCTMIIGNALSTEEIEERETLGDVSSEVCKSTCRGFGRTGWRY